MGALIVTRYERHPIGWLLSMVGLLTSVSLLTEAYAYWVQEADGPGSQALGSAWRRGCRRCSGDRSSSRGWP